MAKKTKLIKMNRILNRGGDNGQEEGERLYVHDI